MHVARLHRLKLNDHLALARCNAPHEDVFVRTLQFEFVLNLNEVFCGVELAVSINKVVELILVQTTLAYTDRNKEKHISLALAQFCLAGSATSPQIKLQCRTGCRNENQIRQLLQDGFVKSRWHLRRSLYTSRSSSHISTPTTSGIYPCVAASEADAMRQAVAEQSNLTRWLTSATIRSERVFSSFSA